jgi:hypothetical protein
MASPILAIALCLVILGAVLVIRLYLDSLDYRYNPETVKARQIQETGQRIERLRKQPITKQLGSHAGTPSTGPEMCDAMLSDAIARNNIAPQIAIAYFDDGADGKLWIDIAVRFDDGSKIVVHTYQESVTHCDQSP